MADAISVKFSADVADFIAALQDVADAADQVSGSASQLSTATAGGGGLSSFGKGLGATGEGAASAAKGLFEMAGQVGEVLTFAREGASIITDFVKSMFDENVATQNATVAYKNLTGSGEQATEMLAGIADFAKTTPFQVDDLRAAGQEMLAIGTNAKDVPAQLKAISTGLAATGADSKELEPVVDMFGQIAATGKVTTREMDTLAKDGFPAWQSLAAGMGTSVDYAMQQVAKGAVNATDGIKAMLNGVTKAFPDALSGGLDTMTGQLNKLADNATDAWTAMAKGPFDLIQAGIKGVNGVIEQLMPGVQGLGKSIDDSFAHFGDWLTNTSGGQAVSKGFGEIVSSVVDGADLIVHSASKIISGADQGGFWEDLASALFTPIGLNASPWNFQVGPNVGGGQPTVDQQVTKWLQDNGFLSSPTSESDTSGNSWITQQAQNYQKQYGTGKVSFTDNQGNPVTIPTSTYTPPGQDLRSPLEKWWDSTSFGKLWNEGSAQSAATQKAGGDPFQQWWDRTFGTVSGPQSFLGGSMGSMGGLFGTGGLLSGVGNIGSQIAGQLTDLKLPNISFGGITSSLMGGLSSLSLPHIDFGGITSSLLGGLGGLSLPHIDFGGITSSLLGGLGGISLPHIDFGGIVSSLSGAFSGISLPHLDLGGIASSLSGAFSNISLPSIPNIGGMISGALSGAFSGITLPSIPNIGGMISGALSGAFGGITLPSIPNIGGMINGALSGVFGGIQLPNIPDIGGMLNGAISGIFGSVHMPQIPDFGSMISGAISGIFAGIHIPSIPMFASGISNFGGGLAIVGEKGPELVNLSSGSSVYPLAGGSSSSLPAYTGGGISAGPSSFSIVVNLDGQALVSQLGVPIAQNIRLSMARR